MCRAGFERSPAPDERERLRAGAGTSDPNDGTGDLYNFAPANYLVTPSQRYNAFSTGDYQFSDTSAATSSLVPQSPVGSAAGVGAGVDPHLRRNLGRQHLQSIRRQLLDVRRRIIETGGRHFTQDIDTFRTVVGADGYIPKTDKSWNWDSELQTSAARRATRTIDGEFIISRLQNAIGRASSTITTCLAAGRGRRRSPAACRWISCTSTATSRRKC